MKPNDLMARTGRTALAIGCGGTLGFAWTAVALRELERALDWDVRSADVLMGTSAGSELVAALGSGRSVQDILDALDGVGGADGVLAAHVARHPGRIPPPPRFGFPATGLIGSGLRNGSAYTALAGCLPRGRGDATWLRAFGADLSGDAAWVPHPNTWVVACDAATGDRVAFGRDDAPAADLGSAIAASWAIPGWFPPVEIGGRCYVDGGSSSSVSADLLIDANVEAVVVVAPMTTEGGVQAKGLNRLERLLRRQMTRGLNREVATLRAAGIRVIRVEPGAVELAAMGPNFMNLSRRPATLAATRHVIATRVANAVRSSQQPKEAST